MSRVFVGALVAVGAHGAVIETRPQMANAQLQNATDAVIRTAAVAGLAYAGAYLAGASGSNSVDSSYQSQYSSSDVQFCDYTNRNPLNYECTAKKTNGKTVKVGGLDATAKYADEVEVPDRRWWCCPSALTGSNYGGNEGGACVDRIDNSGQCVYQGPCAQAPPGSATPAAVTAANTPGNCAGSGTDDVYQFANLKGEYLSTNGGILNSVWRAADINDVQLPAQPTGAAGGSFAKNFQNPNPVYSGGAASVGGVIEDGTTDDMQCCTPEKNGATYDVQKQEVGKIQPNNFCATGYQVKNFDIVANGYECKQHST